MFNEYGCTAVDPEQQVNFAEGFSASTKEELYLAEEEAIVLTSYDWGLDILSSDITVEELTDVRMLEHYHKQCLKGIWSWAGLIRSKDTNIGSDPAKIRVELPETLGTIRFWALETSMEPYEIAIRTHHSLVKIHPFVDVNGRITRSYADLIMLVLTKNSTIDWSKAHEDKKSYVEALRKADLLAGDVTDLMGMFSIRTL